MKDYIIVGFGLSGLALANQLEEAGKSFVVYENYSQSSSKIAGGVMNPVILKRFTLAWDADKQMQVAIDFYKNIEEKFKGTFFQMLPIYRRFSSIKEQNDWFAAADKPILSNYLSTNIVKSIPNLQSNYGYGKVEKASIVNTHKLISSYLEYLKKDNSLIEEEFYHRDLIIKQDFVEYKNIKARKIIFCEGVGMHQNPFFNNLPLGKNKGEYIIIKAPILKLKESVKSSFFIHDLGDDLYKIGATYDHMAKDATTTEAAKKMLTAALDKLILCPYEIVGQEAGLRPTVKDRKPLLGEHSTYKNLFVCNGFGSRGVMIAPNAAKWMIDYIEHGEALPDEVNINRFF